MNLEINSQEFIKFKEVQIPILNLFNISPESVMNLSPEERDLKIMHLCKKDIYKQLEKLDEIEKNKNFNKKKWDEMKNLKKQK